MQNSRQNIFSNLELGMRVCTKIAIMVLQGQLRHFKKLLSRSTLSQH